MESECSKLVSLEFEVKDKNNENNNEINHPLEPYIGDIHDAPQFMKDNRSLLTGYRINFSTKGRILKSLFLIHNETVNIWTHLIMSLVCILMMFNFESVFLKFEYLFNYETRIHPERLTRINPFETYIFSMYNERLVYKDIISKIEDSNFSTDSIKFSNFLEKINLNVDLIEENKIYFKDLNYVQEFSKNLFTIGKLNSRLLNIVNLKNDSLNMNKNLSTYLILILETVEKGVNNIKQAIERAFNSSDEKLFGSSNLEDIIGDYEFDNKSFIMLKWPIQVFLFFSFFCFFCSALYHLLNAHSEHSIHFFSQLDYAGIILLISGSCIPPYYYLYYCNSIYRNFFLTTIWSLSLVVFIMTFIPIFNKPHYRRIRTWLFLGLGLAAASPLIHLVLFFNPKIGMIDDMMLRYWFGGGAFYIGGCFIYLSHMPEKKCPRKFDYCGASHQIWHFFVIFGMLSHLFGCFGTYFDRLGHECPLN